MGRERRSSEGHKYLEVTEIQSGKGSEMRSVQTRWETPLSWKVLNSKFRG